MLCSEEISGPPSSKLLLNLLFQGFPFSKTSTRLGIPRQGLMSLSFFTLVTMNELSVVLVLNSLIFLSPSSFFLSLCCSEFFDMTFFQVEYVIKEQNMVDALVMIENYCYLLIERVTLIQINKLVISFPVKVQVPIILSSVFNSMY